MAAAVASRFYLADWPNFKPVVAVALYAGFLLDRRWWTWLVPLLILLLSDLFIGFYDGLLMASVYLSMLAAVGAGRSPPCPTPPTPATPPGAARAPVLPRT